MPAPPRQRSQALEEPHQGAGRRIGRERLASRVERALRSGTVLITAGAGYGKTTLLEEALGRLDSPVAWISCADAERDPGRFVMRLVEAIAVAAPGASDALAEHLVAAPETVDPGAVVRELIAELSRLLIEPVTLAIDDAEHLAGADDSVSLLGERIRTQVPVL